MNQQRRTVVTIKDIAAAAQVSASTVSLALRDDVRLRPETRDHIKQLAEKLRYIPSAQARGLQSRRSQLIGYLLRGFDSSFFYQLLGHMSRVAAYSDYGILTSCASTAEFEARQLELMRSKNIDGLVVSGCFKENIPLIHRFSDEGIPVVGCCWFNRIAPYPNVETDNRMGGVLAGEHLLSLGHRRLGFCSFNICVIENRYIGFLEAAQACPEASVKRAVGQDEIREMLLQPDRPSAIFVHSDEDAVNLISVARELGLEVPRDLSVIGFNDMPIASMMNLTTLSQAREELGPVAFEMFIKMRGGEEVSDLYLPPQLIVRESTRPYDK